MAIPLRPLEGGEEEKGEYGDILKELENLIEVDVKSREAVVIFLNHGAGESQKTNHRSFPPTLADILRRLIDSKPSWTFCTRLTSSRGKCEQHKSCISSHNHKVRAYENHDVDTPEGLKPRQIDPITQMCESLPRKVNVRLEMRRKKSRGGEEPCNTGKATRDALEEECKEGEEVTLVLGVEDVHLEHHM
ncbi:hypothetical protein LTS18_014310 [Coniosporium uncinatum]|uniref:Uncharacterized protein n=1 Tax=Coniosporium uncinatum TaxID=93489 RepID=A0ACC3DV57_9PEZI|nr:hypothetical protein LTS18_014310 [Coniosporium uncinatum]